MLAKFLAMLCVFASHILGAASFVAYKDKENLKIEYAICRVLFVAFMLLAAWVTEL